MHLKSLTLKGFKSFPDRTRLDFGPGVSVVVGPNGSGKSNVTDALLWAMGEQSPLAVRGSSMQDVIFGGGRGVLPRSGAEVEIVLDNSDATIGLPFAEISIVRRLDRSGEGEYRLNGARCRLVDVIEVLSDTGLGKETHSVISQGRVESIVTSKPRERRLLIEEAAGLGKHRKRRRRAQLKLERTQENLDRALDVEREARTRLRPLKRQAEAAELHDRLERQMLELRLTLAREHRRACAEQLTQAETAVGAAREAQGRVQASLDAVSERRAAAEHALAQRTERHDALTQRSYRARSARERIQLRGEQVAAASSAVGARMSRVEIELRALEQAVASAPEGQPGEDRIAGLEAELERLQAEREQALERELESLDRERTKMQERVARDRAERDAAAEEHRRATERLEAARGNRLWSTTWGEVRELIVDGVERILVLAGKPAREAAAAKLATQVERLASGAIEHAFGELGVLEADREQAERRLREADRLLAEAVESERRALWLIEQRRLQPDQGPDAIRRAELEGELAAERRQADRVKAQRAEREQRIERLRAQRIADLELIPRMERLSKALLQAGAGVDAVLAQLEQLLAADSAEGEQLAGELRKCAHQEAEIHSELRARGEDVTGAEVSAQRLRDLMAEAEQELREVCERLGLADAHEEHSGNQPFDEEQEQAMRARLERLQRRREQLGPVNPLAQDEYGEALAHVEELESRRSDLEAALRELAAVIRDTDKQIHDTFNDTFDAAARNFEELVGDVFPGGSGRLKLVRDDPAPRAVLGGAAAPAGRASDAQDDAQAEDAAEAEDERERDGEEELLGVEIEITPAGKSTKRLSLLSGGEKSMTALAFLFAVFLARPCPFYVLDEVEAALDDLNLDRFLNLLRRYADRAQFIVITHQKRTMEAADWLYGVSMAQDGVSKVLSRRLPREEAVAATASAA
jgi:chromosome segregation protein